MRVAVIGCGLIGRRRALVARQYDAAPVIVADSNRDRALALARDLDCLATSDWREAVARDDVDSVVVSTTNNWLAPVAIAALEHGKHVLVEKPMARNPAEAAAVVEAALRTTVAAGVGTANAVLPNEATPLSVGVGFNHRYHPATLRAHELFAAGAIGDLLFLRCHYGHGGRPGYDKEWRMDRVVSGGGELLDQGVHAIDLFRWFAGDFAEASGWTAGYVWSPGNPNGFENGAAAVAPVEDNAFALFRTAAGQVATLHTSWTQWKNRFTFEVFGRDGYLIVDGLGGSYGPERLTWGRRRPQSGPPDEQRFEFPGPDGSWEAEWRQFAAAVREGSPPLASANDGFQALKMVYAIYESSHTGRVVPL